MNICISCGMQQEHIIQLLQSYQVNDQPYFHYQQTEGMKLYFTCESSASQETIALIKSIMKQDAIGKVLLYRIEVTDKTKE